MPTFVTWFQVTTKLLAESIEIESMAPVWFVLATLIGLPTGAPEALNCWTVTVGELLMEFLLTVYAPYAMSNPLSFMATLAQPLSPLPPTWMMPVKGAPAPS